MHNFLKKSESVACGLGWIAPLMLALLLAGFVDVAQARGDGSPLWKFFDGIENLRTLADKADKGERILGGDTVVFDNEEYRRFETYLRAVENTNVPKFEASVTVQANELTSADLGQRRTAIDKLRKYAIEQEAYSRSLRDLAEDYRRESDEWLDGARFVDRAAAALDKILFSSVFYSPLVLAIDYIFCGQDLLFAQLDLRYKLGPLFISISQALITRANQYERVAERYETRTLENNIYWLSIEVETEAKARTDAAMAALAKSIAETLPKLEALNIQPLSPGGATSGRSKPSLDRSRRGSDHSARGSRGSASASKPESRSHGGSSAPASKPESRSGSRGSQGSSRSDSGPEIGRMR